MAPLVLLVLMGLCPQSARAHPNVLAEPAPGVFVSKVSESGIKVDLNVICDRIGNMDSVRSDLYVAALTAFRARNVLLSRCDKAVPPPPPPAESA